MGAIHFSLDTNLVEALRNELPLSTFVETGTFHGDTLIAMAPMFTKLYSVELSKELWEESSKRLQEFKHVSISLDDSPQFIEKLQPSLKNDSVLYWLDAHWCVSDNTAGEDSQCPLVKEIKAIGKLNNSSAIVIDDARLFLAPPPEPHEISDWPLFEEVNNALRMLSAEHEITIVNDTIAFYPKQCRPSIIKYAAKYGTDWLRIKWGADFALKDNEELHRRQTQSDQILKNTTFVAKSIDDDLLSTHHNILDLIKKLEDKHTKLLEIQSKGLKSLLPTKYQILLTSILEKYYQIRLLPEKIKYKITTVKSSFNYNNNLNKLRLIGKLNHHEPRILQMQNNMPKIKSGTQLPSICIVTPSFNQGEFIESTIQSIINQKYPRLEYVVQDGGSTDNSVAIINKYASDIYKWESKIDKGQSHAINQGFIKSNGEIMGWLNSDDLLMPGTLHFVGNYFAHNPKVDVIYSNRILVDENSNLIGEWVLPKHNNTILKWADFIPQETMFWRRKIWERVGGINEDFQFAMDWDLITRFIAADAKFVRIPKFFGAFRIHTQQKTSVSINTKGIEEMEIIRRRCLGRIPTGKEIEGALTRYYLAHILESRIINKLRIF